MIQNFLRRNQKITLILENIISIAKEYVKFENEKKDLEQIVKDKNNDTEIIELAEKDLNDVKN